MNLNNMLILIFFIIFIALSLIFLFYPTFYASDRDTKYINVNNVNVKDIKKETDIYSKSPISLKDTNQKSEDIIIIQDKIKSIKASLKDLKLENEIGKLSNQDYHILKAELLREWSENEKKIKNKSLS